ncbi:MAG: response regulator [Gammaproteobacteria bacterium]|nr:response regulator [Gammaproteobacteria bacterium]
MAIIKNLIELVFGLALFANALLFLPQIICIIKEKSAKGVSLFTFLGFLLIQLAIIFHALIIADYLLLFGYLLSIITCGSVVGLILWYRKHPNSLTNTSNEQSLEARVEFLENLIAAMPGHVYWLDKNNVYLGCNDNQARTAGLSSRHEIVGKRNKDLPWNEKDPTLAAELERVNQRVMETGKQNVLEEPGTLLNGSTRLYLSNKLPLRDKQHNIIGLLGISFDITEAKKETEKRLKFLDDIMAVMPGNVYWLDRNGIYLGCNNNAAKVVGLKSRQEIVGKRNVDIPGFVIPNIIDSVNEQVFERGETIVTEEPANLLDGTTATFLSSKVPIKNSNEQVVGMVGISIDITELKAAKEKAQAANEAKESFLRNMRHDLRTPFSGLLTLSEWMATQETDPAKKENLECIAQSAQVLLDYMNTVLEHSRRGEHALALENKPFDLEKLINDALLTIKPVTLNKGLQLTMHYPTALPTNVQSDVACLQRIIINLLGNAVKFTHEGEIRVTVSLVKQQAEKVILAISVSDTGIGIPPEKREEIFEKFTRLEAAYEGKYTGMGLGLHEVKELCQQLGGEITVANNIERGSVFTCLLPFELSNVPITSPNTITEHHSVPTTLTSLKVLLVEDQTVAAHAAATVLRSQGYEVDIAPTGRIALEKFTDQSYDVALLDIGLPDTDGFALARQFRKLQAANQEPPTQLIALSAHEHLEGDDIKLFDGILNKPFSLSALDKLSKYRHVK